MKGTEARLKIVHDPSFVYLKRFDFNLDKLMDRYPEGVPNRIIADALMITEDDVEEIYVRIVEKLREIMKVGL